jgi:hypothetical protein
MEKTKKDDDFHDMIKERIIEKALNERNYKFGSGNYEAYCEIGTVMLAMGKHLKTSIDVVRKPEALIFGYILRDFPQFETIIIQSDEINHGLIDRKK